MYIYQLTYEDEGSLLMIGYFGSWKKARSVMKKYRSTGVSQSLCKPSN